ncbi:MAG: helix-turn-helix transcriptional regulator [Acidimicrobiia bacterium]
MTSERTSRRLARILAVLPYIIEHDGADIDDLVERFDYDDKADLVKDLHLVFVTGLPGYGPGDLVDVDIFEDEVHVDAADYFARPLRLTPAEALGLLAAGMTLLESDQAPAALGSAVDKLAQVIGVESAEAVHFDVPTPSEVHTLRDAIETGRVVRIGYVGMASNERSERDVEGWNVSFSLGNWYLTGHCRLAGDRRVFRIDRIDSIEVLEDQFEPPSSSQGMVGYQPSESDVHVEFTVTSTARWVAEYYPVDAEELDGGDLRIRMSVADPLVAGRLLLQLGPDVSDVEGNEVVAARDELRNRILATYASAK